MAALVWVLVVVLILLNGYILAFDQQTRAMGRSLATTDFSGNGFQDAITPPWHTAFSFAVYAATIVVVGLVWWWLGWLAFIAAVVIGFIGAGFVSGIFSALPTGHYRRLILASMMNRYANFVRDGDTVRAFAMKELLSRSGFDPDEFLSPP